jgi:hypothetical protein
MSEGQDVKKAAKESEEIKIDTMGDGTYSDIQSPGSGSKSKLLSLLTSESS